MEIEKAVVKFGTEAVMLYCQISNAKHDNELPEVFLGSFIAQRLFDEFHFNTHVERYYTVIAEELKIERTNELLNELGGLRADLAIYRDQLPSAIHRTQNSR